MKSEHSRSDDHLNLGLLLQRLKTWVCSSFDESRLWSLQMNLPCLSGEDVHGEQSDGKEGKTDRTETQLTQKHKERDGEGERLCGLEPDTVRAPSSNHFLLSAEVWGNEIKQQVSGSVFHKHDGLMTRFVNPGRNNSKMWRRLFPFIITDHHKKWLQAAINKKRSNSVALSPQTDAKSRL